MDEVQGIDSNPNTDRSKALNIASIILAFLFAPIGLILSVVAYKVAAREGRSKTVPLVGIIVALIIILLLFVPAVAMAVFENSLDKVFQDVLLS